jgi:hypothetical protein
MTARGFEGRALPALLAVALCASACASTRARFWSWGLPGFGQEASVSSVEQRQQYLDAHLQVEGEDYRFLFPGSYDCTQVVKAGNVIDYGDYGLLPRVRSAEGRCDPIGVLSLEKWAVHHRRAMTPANRESEVTFEEFYRDDDVVLVRGTFHFAHWVVLRQTRGGGLDEARSVVRQAPVIAVIPNRPECQKALSAGKAKAEYHEEGAPYRLVSGSDVCLVLGMAKSYQPPRKLTGGQVVE